MTNVSFKVMHQVLKWTWLENWMFYIVTNLKCTISFWLILLNDKTHLLLFFSGSSYCSKYEVRVLYMMWKQCILSIKMHILIWRKQIRNFKRRSNFWEAGLCLRKQEGTLNINIFLCQYQNISPITVIRFSHLNIKHCIKES